MYCYVIFWVCLIFSLCLSFPHCVNEEGDDVDWFYMYKLPRDKAHPNPRMKKGVVYMYMTSKTLKQGWILSQFGIDSNNSMLAQTLTPIHKGGNTMFSIIYNDQPPLPIVMDSEPFTELEYESGHTKGVVFGDQFTGVWLVHSVPKFPQIPDELYFHNISYHYPPTGMKFGQSFLCMSVDTATLNQIGMLLQYNEPELVYSHIPEDLKNEVPNLVAVVQKITIRSPPWHHTEIFETIEGRKFKAFAKTGKFLNDLYTGLVADGLQTDLLVETWINGAGILDSDCNKDFKVYNIEAIKFPLLNISFTSHYDHSKWTIAEAPEASKTELPRKRVDFLRILMKSLNRRKKYYEADDHWVCVGDINRALSQEHRGGGTVCTTDPILWKNYNSLIKSIQPCK